MNKASPVRQKCPKSALQSAPIFLQISLNPHKVLQILTESLDPHKVSTCKFFLATVALSLLNGGYCFCSGGPYLCNVALLQCLL